MSSSAGLKGKRRRGRMAAKGPTVFVKIHADLTTVITSTDVIGKGEFAESLFRKRLDELTEVRAADEGTAELKTDSPMLEMRFDRNGETLRLIISAMRGYPMADKLEELPVSDRKMFLADCKFYQLPSLLTKFGSSSPETRAVVWDSSRVQTDTHSIAESLLVRKGANGSWQCNGLTEVIRSGDSKWVEFKIRKTAGGALMFGVIEADNKATDGHFGQPMKGVGYSASNGFLLFPTTDKKSRKMFSGPSGAGDNIRIKVWIAASGKSARMTMSKNGAEIGSEELSTYIAVDGGLVFAVCTRNTGDEINIVDSGM